jgi:predicted DNA-binding ArsR family transcriptional regulator
MALTAIQWQLPEQKYHQSFTHTRCNTISVFTLEMAKIIVLKRH